MSKRAVPSRFKSVLNNGVGRFVCQLRRLAFKFCKEVRDCSRRTKYFLENYLLEFIEKYRGNVVDVQPQQNREPQIVFQNYLEAMVIAKTRDLKIKANEAKEERLRLETARRLAKGARLAAQQAALAEKEDRDRLERAAAKARAEVKRAEQDLIAKEKETRRLHREVEDTRLLMELEGRHYEEQLSLLALMYVPETHGEAEGDDYESEQSAEAETGAQVRA